MKYLIYQGQHIAETLFLNMVNIQHHIKKKVIRRFRKAVIVIT